MKFRKKPIVVDAIQWTGKNWPDVYDFIHQDGTSLKHHSVSLKDKLAIETLENGITVVDVNGWIIVDVERNLYFCKPDIFEATYEPINE